MTRVVHLVPEFDPTGAAAQMEALSVGLAQHGIESISITIGSRRRVSTRTPPHYLARRAGCDWQAWRRWRAMVRELQPTIVQSWLPVDDLFASFMCRNLPSRVWLASWRQAPTRPWSWVDRILWRGAKQVIAPTTGLAENAAGQGIARSRIVTIGDLSTASTSSNAPPTSALAIPEGAKLVLAVGSWHRRELPYDLIWATSLASVVRDDVHLLLFTYGGMDDDLRRFRQAVLMDNRVHFLPAAEFEAWLPRAHVVCSARSDPGLSPELILAKHAGVPLVLADTIDQRAFTTSYPQRTIYPIGDRAGVTRGILRWVEESAVRMPATECHDQSTLAAWRELYRSLV